MTITKSAENHFAVWTDEVLSDGSMRADTFCVLIGNVLKSDNRPGFIRIGGNMKIVFGPKSLARVQAMIIGQTETF